jgi:hypothetical protein
VKLFRTLNRQREKTTKKGKIVYSKKHVKDEYVKRKANQRKALFRKGEFIHQK